MNTELRETYNRNFTQEKYQAFLDKIENRFQYKPHFRISESPIFIPNAFRDKLIAACDDIMEVICRPDIQEKTEQAFIDSRFRVPNETARSHFFQLDFGICKDKNGELTPQLIELQGFPSLYFFQDVLMNAYKDVFDLPSHLSNHLNGLQSRTYIKRMRKLIVGNCDPKEVVMLEVQPENQHTYIDFLATERYLDIKVLCYSKLIKRGKKLFYKDEKGKEIRIKRIYNRVIFDELFKRPDIQGDFHFQDEVDVEWIGHPNWFFRISKFTLPLLSGPYVPDCQFLDRMTDYPENLNEYVLKPLYSFSGSGVQIDFTKEDLDAIKDPHNYILQKKVSYEPAIISPNPEEPVKGEVRMMLIWEDGEAKPRIVNNLVRLSKGKMIGVKYNKNKDWVGASVGLFE